MLAHAASRHWIGSQLDRAGAVLSECTGRSTVAIWVHCVNRVRPGTLESVGFFNNSHMLGIELAPGATGLEAVRHVGRVVTSAIAHQELPLPHLWNALRCVPRFQDVQVLMDFRTVASSDAAPIHPGGVRVERFILPDAVTPRFSRLGVYVIDDGASMRIAATYAAARFAQTGVRQLLSGLRAAILATVNDPGAPLWKGSASTASANAGMGEFLLLDSACIPLTE